IVLLFCGFSFARFLGFYCSFFLGFAFRAVGSSFEFKFRVFVTGEAPVVLVTNNALSSMVNRMQRAAGHAFFPDHDALSMGLGFSS
ncbi:MAG: hypothetical protein VYB61_04300, partial [Verrucomicrobiota bacterium]|nr:hypothetical protein [Verrucomicrobiota bacterium]